MDFTSSTVKDLPDFKDWRKINPRKPNPDNQVSKAIKETLGEDPNFFFINRGLVLTVDSYEFDQKESILHLNLTDVDVHGLLDGGHTYEIILRDRDSLPEMGLEQEQYVKLEILTGFPPTDAVTIVEGRNTSNQVKPKSIANLRLAFNRLKEVIQDTGYADKVAYRENEETLR